MAELEIGKYYRTRNGDEAYCVGIDPYPKSTNDSYICVLKKKAQAHRYFPNGNWMAEEQESEYHLDIIGEQQND